MTAPSKISKRDRDIFKELNDLDARDASIIPSWLIEIKKDPTATKVINLLTDKEISTTAPSGVYNSIIKWCMEKYQGDDFDDIPNAQKFATATPAATAAVAKPNSPDIDVFLIAKKWKENPKIDPFTGEQIDISIDLQSKYVVLYQKVIDKLIKHILKKKPRARGMLTVDECKNIKDSLPNAHALAPNIKIYYDYLFIKYFVNNTARVNYKSDFVNNVDIYLYKTIFDSQVTRSYNRGETVEDLLIAFEIEKSSLSINVLVMNLCFDIRDIIYMHESKITSEAINRVIENKAILEYCISILRDKEKREIEVLQMSFMNEDLKNALNIYNNRHDPKIAELIRSNNIRNNAKHNIYYILMQIVKHCATDDDICKTLLTIYNCILKLYSDNNIKNTVYKYIKDPYNIYENEKEPNMPIKPQLSRELQMYKIRLNNLKNAVKDAEKDMVKVGKKPLLSLANRKFKSEDNIVKPQGVSMLKYSVKSKAFTSINNKEDMKKVLKLNKMKRELKDFEEKVEEIDGKEIKINLLNKENLKIYDEKIEEWKERLKVYEKDMEIYERKKEKYDRLPLYEKEKVGKKPLLSLSNVYNRLNKGDALLSIGNRKFKSEDIIRPPSVSLLKYSVNLKAFTSISNMKKHSTFKEKEEGYYLNVDDPYTQEEFKGMEPKKRKYVSDILYKNDNNKEFHYQFDTVNIYNYVLKCIENCDKPINFYTNTEFTDANLDEICDKIKHFTRYPTYNSSFDIRARLNNCIYNNMLVLDYEQVPFDYSKEIIGQVNVYLHINLGGVLFKVINKIQPVIQNIITKYDNFPNLTNALNSQVLTLPYFNRNINGQDIYTLYPSGLHTYPEDVIYILNTMLSKGDLIGNKYFPYRKNNIKEQIWKTIMKVPKFKFSLNDNAKETLEKLKTYQEEIQRQ